jgi:LPXTG-motif cell wall-anchored protein
MIVVSSTVFLMGADRVVNVPCGQDLDAIVNADDPAIGTRFQLEGGCTYTVDTMVELNEGDELAGPQATFIERAPAFDPEPTVTIVGSEGVSHVIRARGTVRLEWVKIVGGTGQYSGGSPVAGTGSGLAMGMASNTSTLYAVHITGSDGAGITNAQGTFDRIELDDTTQDPNFLGFIGSGLKAINEVEVRNSYVHDNPGNGLWCDAGCVDSTNHPNGFWVHDNLVVNNGRAGIRFENVGGSNAGEALIENNEVHGNSPDAARGGISVRDAQNATLRNNRFGAATIAGVVYPPNSSNVAIVASDSGRADRPDLFNIDILSNILNGETVKGCELTDEIVFCSEAQPPPPPPTTDTTGADTTGTTGAAATTTGTTDTTGTISTPRGTTTGTTNTTTGITSGTTTGQTDTTSTTTATTENIGSSSTTGTSPTASPPASATASPTPGTNGAGTTRTTDTTGAPGSEAGSNTTGVAGTGDTTGSSNTGAAATAGSSTAGGDSTSPRDDVIRSTIPRGGELPNTGGASVVVLLMGCAAIGAGLLFMLRR